MKITILYDLPSKRFANSEFSVTEEDTEVTARIVEASLKRLGYTTVLFPITIDQPEKVKEIRADCIFNLVEWTGSDIKAAKTAFIQLENLKIPYTGCDWEGYIISAEKTLMKKKLEKTHTLTPKSIIISHNSSLTTHNLRYPLIIKLASDHCSIGLERESVVHNVEELNERVAYMQQKFHDDVLVEEFIVGREFQLTAIEKMGAIDVLPPVEITFTKPDELNFLTFGGRWDEDHPDYMMSDMVLPKHLPEEVWKTMQAEAKRIFPLFHLRDYARFDLRVRNSEVFFLEVNSNPGIDDSLECGVTLSAHTAGISFDQLIKGIIDSAMRRSI